MTDPEIEELRGKVHCAVVLERTPPLWKLDRKESTRLGLKYRRGKGEILGWWDPMSDAKATSSARATAGARTDVRPCPNTLAGIRRPVAKLSDRQ